MRRTTLLAIILMVMALSAPAALIHFSKSQPVGGFALNGDFGARPGGTAGAKVWLTTPAFSIRDADGENRVFVAALKLQDRVAATRLCRWMPIIRDRIQVVISGVDRQFAALETPTLSLEKRRLHNSLREVLDTAAPSQVAFIDAHLAPSTVLQGGVPALCNNRGLDDRRSHVFTG